MSNASDFIIENGALKKYVGPGGEVAIPDGVTEILERAFQNCSKLVSVVIPDSVTGIGALAFFGCGNLESVEIPTNVNRIGESAFGLCKKLKCVTIPENAELGGSLFSLCSCKVRCKHFTPQLEAAMKDINDTTLYTEDDISEIPVSFRRRALLGFVSEKEIDYDSEPAKSYLAYAKRNSGKLVDLAEKHPGLLGFLCVHRLIAAKDVDAYMAVVEKIGDTEKKALLLDYQNQLGKEKVSKAREKKEKAKEDYADALVERVAARDPANGIAGMTFVVTGKLWPWGSRDDIKAYLESYGALLGSSVNKKTDYLVVSDPKSRSDKTKKAEELGVQVISEADFNEMVGMRYKDATHVSILKWIRTIPEEAFVRCKSMTEVTIPEGVTSIGNKAFEGCGALQIVHLPESLTEIGEEAFHKCIGIEKLSLPAGITRIGKGAFSECRDISFSFGTPAVSDLVRESSFNISDNGVLFKYVGPGGDVVIPEGVKEFFLFPFSPSYGSQSQVTAITLPDSMTVISGSAFSGCSKLERVVIPESVQRIEKGAFMSCVKLTGIKLPKGLTELGPQAFYNCKSLTSVELPKNITVIEEGFFSDCAELESVTLTGPITEIKPNAFSGCEKLRSMILPEGVRTIGAHAFINCKGLAEMNIPESVSEIGEGAFGGCISLKTVWLPAGLRDLSDSVFSSAESLVSVDIPESVTSIGSGAFAYCSSLSCIKIPKGVTNIGAGAFAGCTALPEIGIDEENACYTGVDGVLFNRERTELIQYPCGRVGSYTIPDGVRSIRFEAFRWCPGLTEVVIPESVTSIEGYAFSVCKALTSIRIPESVTEIGEKAFAGCGSLTIHAPAGSYAEQYAKAKNIPFVVE